MEFELVSEIKVVGANPLQMPADLLRDRTVAAAVCAGLGNRLPADVTYSVNWHSGRERLLASSKVLTVVAVKVRG
jgi:hypothetical protein